MYGSYERDGGVRVRVRFEVLNGVDFRLVGDGLLKILDSLEKRFGGGFVHTGEFSKDFVP